MVGRLKGTPNPAPEHLTPLVQGIERQPPKLWMPVRIGQGVLWSDRHWRVKRVASACRLAPVGVQIPLTPLMVGVACNPSMRSMEGNGALEQPPA